MKSYSIEDLQTCLLQGGVSTGDLVMLHSSLIALGRIKIRDGENVLAKIGHCIKGIVGSEGTIVVPAFNFGFCNGNLFDRQNTPSEKMGALSEWYRNQPDSLRSTHPMQSISAVGPMAKTICETDTPSAFDFGGAFYQLLKHNAKIVLLGTSLQAASIIHYSEQLNAVPYRYWKRFSGPYRDLDNQVEKNYLMYVRNMSINPQLSMKPIENELNGRSHIHRETLGAGVVRFCTSQDLVSAADYCLRLDPWCLVASRN